MEKEKTRKQLFVKARNRLQGRAGVMRRRSVVQSPKGKRMKQQKDGVAVLCIDPQVDFHPGGSLAIAGADSVGCPRPPQPTAIRSALVLSAHTRQLTRLTAAAQDAERVGQLLKDHAARIDDVVVTLDSHQRMHIAHGLFWRDVEGAASATRFAGQRPRRGWCRARWHCRQ